MQFLVATGYELISLMVACEVFKCSERLNSQANSKNARRMHYAAISYAEDFFINRSLPSFVSSLQVCWTLRS